MITKENLIKIAKKEFATTLKVIHAYPQDKLDFTPHERSQTAKRIMSTFIFEMFLVESYVFNESLDRSIFKDYSPAKLENLIEDFEKHSAKVISKLETANEQELNKSVEFAGVKFPADAFIFMMICDQIHHRGQMTVYIRMAGGKVPSVYGPSADDQSRNLV